MCPDVDDPEDDEGDDDARREMMASTMSGPKIRFD